MEPHVDAVDVEAVMAFGEQSCLLVVLEFAQTYSALEPVFVIRRLINEHGKRFYRRFSKADTLEPRGVLLADKGETTASERAPAPPEVARVDVQTQNDENCREDKYDGCQEDFAADGHYRRIETCIILVEMVRTHGRITTRH